MSSCCPARARRVHCRGALRAAGRGAGPHGPPRGEIGPALELGACPADRPERDAVAASTSTAAASASSTTRASTSPLSDPPSAPRSRPSRLPLGSGHQRARRADGHDAVLTRHPQRPACARPPSASSGRTASSSATLAVPLIVFGESIGAASRCNSGDVDAFEDDDRTLLEGLATQVAGAIESARRFEKVAELEILKSDFIARGEPRAPRRRSRS